VRKVLPPTTYPLQPSHGFTLIEAILVVAMIGILTGISVPLSQNFQNRNELDIAANATAQSLRRARVLSQSVAGDTSWGVKIQTGSVVMFKGASYATRDTTFDETFTIPSNLTISNLSEVVFTKFTGLPQSTGTTTITSLQNESKNITINSQGRISH
jgi:prepilin-type N-terminal cleavage/methylation domain-containing protein